MALDSLRSYSSDHNLQLQSIMQVNTTQQFSTEVKTPECRLPVDVLEALNKGDLDEAMKKLQEQEKPNEDSLMWFFSMMNKVQGGLNLMFSWPQIMITKRLHKHTKPQIDKKAEFAKKSEEEKRAEIKKEAEKLRGLRKSEESGKAEVDVDVGGGKIEAGSIEWHNEMLRISQMAHVAKSIGTPKLLHTILEILISTLHLSQAAEHAKLVAKKYDNYVESAKKAMEAMWTKITDAVSNVVSPIVVAAVEAAEAMRRRLANAVEKMGKKVKSIEETVKKKSVEIAQVIEPPLRKIIDPVKEICKLGLDRIQDASEAVKRAAEQAVEKTEAAVAAIATMVNTTIPAAMMHGVAWVYQLSPGTFDGIGNNFMRMVKTVVKVANWLGGKSAQAFTFIWTWTVKAGTAIKEVAVMTIHLLARFWVWLKGIIVDFIKKSYRLTIAFLKWTVATIKATPGAIRAAIYRLFHLSKDATERLAMRLERPTRR